MGHEKIRPALISLVALLSLLQSVLADSQPTKYRGMTYGGESSEDLQALRTLGANLVAYQISWPGEEIDAASGSEYQIWFDERLNRLETLVNASPPDLKFLLVLFSPPGGFETRDVPARHRFFVNNSFRTQFVEAWQKIADRFAGNGKILGYDLLNEPAPGSFDSAQWNSIASQLVAAIRSLDPDHLIVIEPIYGNPRFLKKLPILSDANLAYAFHPYFPSRYRQQGLEGRPIKHPYPDGDFNFQALEKSVSSAMKFAKKNNVELIASEFSAPCWAVGVKSYLRDLVRIFEKNRWDWAVHAWREVPVWSIEHRCKQLNTTFVGAANTDRGRYFTKAFGKNNN